jgi:hypothetical protein
MARPRDGALGQETDAEEVEDQVEVGRRCSIVVARNRLGLAARGGGAYRAGAVIRPVCVMKSTAVLAVGISASRSGWTSLPWGQRTRGHRLSLPPHRCTDLDPARPTCARPTDLADRREATLRPGAGLVSARAHRRRLSPRAETGRTRPCSWAGARPSATSQDRLYPQNGRRA